MIGFGPRFAGSGWLLAGLGLLALGRPGPAGAETPDSTGTYLERLQSRNARTYSPELLATDSAVRDSAMAILDSLGFEGYRRWTQTQISPWDLSLLPAVELLAYHRVEGLVFGLGGRVESNRHPGLELAAEGAWATASGRFRHISRLGVPVGPVRLEGGYADRVVPFGSSRVALSGVRALIGGSDDQDYLHRQGGWGGLRLESGTVWRLWALYAAESEGSVARRSVWSLFGDLDEPNPSVGDGTRRSIDLGVEAGSIGSGRQRLEWVYRLAGGGLGGDFSFHRTELRGELRRYLLFGTEAHLSLGWTETGGATPDQERADLGGLSTVRGFPRRNRVGEESLSGRLETYLPLDPLAWTRLPGLEKSRLQIVCWGDAGRVWGSPEDSWLTSLGFGVQRYLGPFGPAAHLRLDVAFPTGPERPQDIAVALHFTQALF